MDLGVARRRSEPATASESWMRVENTGCATSAMMNTEQNVRITPMNHIVEGAVAWPT